MKSGASLVALALAVASSVLLAACAEESDEVGPEALEAALVGLREAPGAGHSAAEPLPLAGAAPHRLRALGRFTLRFEDRDRSRVVISRTIDRGPGGRFHVRDDRTWHDPHVGGEANDSGHEALFDGERFAVRRAWGPWMERETLGGHEDRMLRAAYDLAPSVLAAFGPYLLWEPAPDPGEATLAGLPVRWETARLDTGVAPRPMEEAELAELRDHESSWIAWLAATHRPTEVTARVARRTEGGEVLAGRFHATGNARVEGRSATFEIDFNYEVQPLPESATFELPKERIAARRERPWKLIRDVLGEDLLETYRPE